MKEGDVIKCPDCKGTGRVRDWFETVVCLGFPLLFQPDECERCDGTGYIRVVVKK